jgi:hypothetical protein
VKALGQGARFGFKSPSRQARVPSLVGSVPRLKVDVCEADECDVLPGSNAVLRTSSSVEGHKCHIYDPPRLRYRTVGGPGGKIVPTSILTAQL